MPSFNKVILMGNLTRDPELRHTVGGTAVCSLGLAVSRKYKDKEETCFVDITVWNKQGESCNQYLSKGRSILVEGRLNFRTWESQDGQKRSKLDVVAENVTFLGKSEKGGEKPSRNMDEANDSFPSNDDIPF